MRKFLADVLKGGLGRFLGHILELLPWALPLAWVGGIAAWAGGQLLAPVPRFYVLVGAFLTLALTLGAFAAHERITSRLTKHELSLLVLLERHPSTKVGFLYAAHASGLTEPRFDLLVHKLWKRGLIWDWDRDSNLAIGGDRYPRELQIRDEGKTLLLRLLARNPGLFDE